jgi:hypothetical protein
MGGDAMNIAIDGFLPNTSNDWLRIESRLFAPGPRGVRLRSDFDLANERGLCVCSRVP